MFNVNFDKASKTPEQDEDEKDYFTYTQAADNNPKLPSNTSRKLSEAGKTTAHTPALGNVMYRLEDRWLEILSKTTIWLSHVSAIFVH